MRLSELFCRWLWHHDGTRRILVLPLGPQWGESLAGSAVRTNECEKLDIRADAAAASNPGRPAYMRAMSACLQGCGYTVN